MKHIILILMICLIINTTSCSSNTKEFQSNIYDLLEKYNTATSTDDLLIEDLNFKVAAGDLRKISKIYENSKDKDKLNIYLDKHISKDIFDEICEYNKENTQYTIEESLKQYYNKK